MAYPNRRLWSFNIILSVWILLMTGCARDRVMVRHANPYGRGMNLAVVPFRNVSGSSDVDVLAVTDEFYTELQQVEGIDVIPVNRVLATLGRLGLKTVEQVDDVFLLAEALDVDGVVVGSVTRYDPYPPPEMGMALQLYLRDEDHRTEEQTYVNPGELVRAGQPLELRRAKLVRPTAMVVRIYDARQDEVVQRVKQYASSRGAPDTPYDWRRYTTRRNYLRFVSYEMIGEMLSQERERIGGHAVKEESSSGGKEVSLLDALE